MRPIKFRVRSNGHIIGYETIFDGRWHWKGLSGVKWFLDKQKAEIYENDILGLVHKKHGLQNAKKIVWDEGNACFDWEDANGESWPDGFTGFYDEYEVIGDIYQNKELLS